MNRSLPISEEHKRTSRFFISLLLFIATVSTAFGQVSLVKDINNTNSEVYADEFNYMLNYHGKLYFIFRNELWTSDGTFGGTQMVKSFDQLWTLCKAGDVLFAVARDDDHGIELWKSDGTAEGTALLKDIYPGTSNSGVANLIDVNGQLFFTASDGITGTELWKSDGTPNGTMIVKDILRVAGSSKPQNLVVANGYLYFRANDGSHGYELWRSDGTSGGTFMVVDINPASKSGGNPEQIANADGTLYFFANNGIDGKQLWKSNGTAGNAELVKIIQPGGTPNLDYLTALNNMVCFQANDGIHGAEIWRSNGTAEGTYLLKDITPGPGSDTEYATPHLNNFKTVNGKLYFLAMEVGVGLWSTDGTEAGTVQITHYDEVSFSWISPNCAPYNGEVYFAGMDWNAYGLGIWKTNGTAGNFSSVKKNVGDDYSSNPMFTELNGDLFFIGKGELWKTNGTPETTSIVRAIGPVVNSTPLQLTDVNGTLYFSATNDDYNHSLWKSDGTESGTREVYDEVQWIEELTNINGEMYFSGRTYQGAELYKSDGSTAGTYRVKNIAEDPSYPTSSSNPAEFTELNGEILFRAALRDRNSDLWKTDGTEEGTVMVDDADPSTHQFIQPQKLTRVGNKIFFVAENNLGSELWTTDGTKAGTTMARDIKLHYRGSNPIQLTAFNNMLFFQADNSGNGYELWKSDGTSAGTSMVKDFRTGDLGSGDALAPIDMGNMMVMNGALYLTAIRTTGKNALWRSDGTNGGTRVIKEFAGQPASDILAVVGNYLYYTLSYDTYLEIWKSDGTAAGTTLVESTTEIKSLVTPYVIASTDDVVYFLGNTGTAYKIWRTDGTSSGTYQIIFNGDPRDLEISGSRIYLSGVTEDYGWELYTINESVSSGRIKVVTNDETPAPESTEIVVSSYPNPFTERIVIHVPGKENEKFKMKVFRLNGSSVEEGELTANADYTTGDNWESGIYLLQINTSEKRFVQKIVKQKQ